MELQNIVTYLPSWIYPPFLVIFPYLFIVSFTFFIVKKNFYTDKIEHERIPPKTPNMNAHINSFHRLLEYECLKRCMFQTYAEAYQRVATYY
ncbi:integrase core domain-containing protein [Bacillus sp. S13(2024)]